MRKKTSSEIDALLDEWTNRQDMTWAVDDASKAKLRGIVERGVEAIRSRAGNPALAFTGENKSLLFDYCRYDLNNCREQFDAAFAHELTMLRLREGFGCGKGKSAMLQ